jgi:hypothetical protein
MTEENAALTAGIWSESKHLRDLRGRFAAAASRSEGRRAQKHADEALKAYDRGDHATGDRHAKAAFERASNAAALDRLAKADKPKASVKKATPKASPKASPKSAAPDHGKIAENWGIYAKGAKTEAEAEAKFNRAAELHARGGGSKAFRAAHERQVRAWQRG